MTAFPARHLENTVINPDVFWKPTLAVSGRPNEMFKHGNAPLLHSNAFFPQLQVPR